MVLAEIPQARLGINLNSREVQMAQELLHLVDGNLPGIEQNRGHRMPKEMRIAYLL